MTALVINFRTARKLRNPAALPPKPPYKPSPAEFWTWFDALTVEERAALNYALNGPDLQFRYKQTWDATKHRMTGCA